MENNLDWIKSVKEQKNGYLVNNSMSVPIADGNRHYKDVVEWLKSNTAEPQFTADEIAEYDGKQYARDRAEAYPSIADQLDDIYHNGVAGWKAEIKAVKEKYPKA